MCKSLESLTDSIELYKLDIEDSLSKDDNVKFISLMDDFRTFLKDSCSLLTGCPQLYGQLINFPEYYNYKTYFTSCEGMYERLIEIQEKDNILSVNEDLESLEDYLSLDYNKRFYNDILNEFRNIEKFIEKSKKFVMIGCGSFPLTLFTIGEKFNNLNIIGIDSSPEAIINAKSLKNKLSFINVSFEILDGINYNYHSIDTIFIANLVIPKTNVLKRIAMTCQSGTTILLRTPIMYGSLLSEDVNYMELQSFKLVKEIEPNSDTDDILYKLLVLEKI